MDDKGEKPIKKHNPIKKDVKRISYPFISLQINPEEKEQIEYYLKKNPKLRCAI